MGVNLAAYTSLGGASLNSHDPGVGGELGVLFLRKSLGQKVLFQTGLSVAVRRDLTSYYSGSTSGIESTQYLNTTVRAPFWFTLFPSSRFGILLGGGLGVTVIPMLRTFGGVTYVESSADRPQGELDAVVGLVFNFHEPTAKGFGVRTLVHSTLFSVGGTTGFGFWYPHYTSGTITVGYQF